MDKPPIALYRLPRSGSTLVKRALQVICCLKENSHYFFVPSAPLVSTYRNPEDLVASWCRIYAEVWPPKEEDILLALGRVHRSLRTAKRMIRKYGGTIWIYEKHRSPEAFKTWAISNNIVASISETEYNQIQKICDVEAVIKHQQSLPSPDPGSIPFSIYDSKTGIHKNHIGLYKGQPGAWQEIIPNKYHELIKSHRFPSII